jgi:hypothetical protein
MSSAGDGTVSRFAWIPEGGRRATVVETFRRVEFGEEFGANEHPTVRKVSK